MLQTIRLLARCLFFWRAPVASIFFLLICTIAVLPCVLQASAVAAPQNSAPKTQLVIYPEHQPPEKIRPELSNPSSKPAPPRIPEPMVFDLVRPLGAKKGELEVNALGTLPLQRDARLDWAPEIEYAFKDGQAIELELPFVNTGLQTIKTTYQATFGTGFDNKFIHGAQIIAKLHLKKTSPAVDVLYIAGYRFNSKWSSMAMLGIRHSNLRGGGYIAGLVNPSVFYTVNDKLLIGLEGNSELSDRQHHYVLLMPQARISLPHHNSLQIGAGIQHTYHHFSPVVGIRVVHSF